MVYTIDSGAAPTSAPIGSGAVPSNASVPIGTGATPNFNRKTPTITHPTIDIPISTTTSSNNNRPPSRSVNVDCGTRTHHHRRHSHGCDDFNNRHGSDGRLELGASSNVNPTSSSRKCNWRWLGAGIVCLLIFIVIGVLLTIGLTNDWFENWHLD